MSKFEIDFPKNSPQLLKSVGRAFIGLIVIILADFIWEAIRDKCNVLQKQGVISWVQLLVSWIILAFVLAIIVPKNMMRMMVICIIVGLLIGAVGTPCHEERSVGNYLLDILQGVTTTMAAGAGIYGLGSALKWYK